MKISIVIVCRNAAATIGYALESIGRQTHADREIVVIDGASSDGTQAIARPFLRVGDQLISEPDRGLYDAMNKGLQHFRGDAVGFLNADDCYADDTALERIAGGLSNADIVHGSLDFVADHRSHRVVRRWRAGDFCKGAFRRGWMPAHPTFYVRRAVVDAVQAFDTAHRAAADYDFMLRALELFDFRVKKIDGVLVKMMTGGVSTSGPLAYLRHNLEALRSRRRWLGSGFIDYALFAKPLGKLPQLLGRGSAEARL